MSHQNTRGGFSGRYQRPDGSRGGFSGRYQRPDGSRGGFSGRSPCPDGSRGGFSGRSPRPDGHYSHRNRQDGASKPFADENRMSQGRGKHPHHVSTGSGSKHFKDKPASNCVYRPKTPSSDIISNSLEAGGSNMKQPECFEASDSSFALADSKNLHLNDEASKPFAHDFLRTKDGMSQDTRIFSHRIKQPECSVSSDSVCGDDIHPLSGQSDSKNTHLDVIRNPIGETPEKKAEDGATSKADISGKVKVGHMLETLPPAKADDTEDQASQEKGTKNLSSIGNSAHSVTWDGASKPFSNQNRMSQGRGKHPHHVYTGSGSKHFKDKPASNCVYRPKTPSPDVISNSLEAGGNNMKQHECFEASDSSFAQANSKNLHLNDEASKPFAHDFLRTKDGMSQGTQIFSQRIKQPECSVSSDSVCGDDIHPLSGQSDSKNTHLDVIRNPIGETPEKKAEDGATSKADISGKVKVGHMLETLPPAKADDTEDQASQEKGTRNLSSIGDSAHSVTWDGASKPFANQNRMSQGRGKHPHHVYTGSGSKHFKDKPASNCLYRPKTPSPDVISNSLEAGGNNMKQPECFEASDSSFAQADSKNLHLNDEASKPFAHDFLRTKDGMSQGTRIFSHRIKQPECALSSDSVCGDDSHPLSGQSDSENTHLDVIRNQIGETPENKAEDGAISGKVKVGHMRETLPPAKADDTEDQASQEKGTNNLSSIGDSGHSVQQAVDKPFDICPPERWSSMLKPSLLEMNKQKRNDIKRSIEGKVQTILGPGMVLLKNYLALSDQVNIVKECRDLGLGPGGFYQPSYRGGGSLHLKMMCLGKNWDPETSKYSDIRPTDGAKPPAIPAEFYKLVGKAIQDSRALIGEKTRERNIEAELPRMLPDICIANFYLATGKLGLHQDKDESQESIDKGLPVVSFSIGDSADFLYGDSRDVDNAQKVTLESGDVLIFGGKSRRIFHGVANIIPATAPKSLPEKTNIRQGRLNLTFRQY